MIRLAVVIVLWLAAVPAICAPTPQPSNSPQVQRQLKEIMSAPEYNRVYGQSGQSNFAKRILGTIGQKITAFIEWLRASLALKGDSAGRVASFIFASLVLIGFAVLLILLVRKLFRSGPASSERKLRGDLDSIFSLPSSKPLIAQAASMAEAGDYRRAFGCAYMASISYLDEIRALRFQRGRTNWEYLLELKRGGFDGPYGALRKITPVFDRAIYGGKDCAQTDYLDALNVYQQIISEAAA